MSRELVTPLVGERIVVEVGPMGQTAPVRVTKRHFHPSDPSLSGFIGVMPSGKKRYFYDSDIAYVPANFVEEG